MIVKEDVFGGGRKSARYAICVILIHLAVTLAHGLTHIRLGIALSVPQVIFVAMVITVAPLIAGYGLGKGRFRFGGALLATSMAGAFAFGVFHHIIAVGPDNMAHDFPPGLASWAQLFNQTAIGLAGLEALGFIFGLIVFLRSDGNANKS